MDTLEFIFLESNGINYILMPNCIGHSIMSNFDDMENALLKGEIGVHSTRETGLLPRW